MNNTSKVLLAALGGAAVGAGLALLFAPASGKETRDKISEKAKGAQKGVEDLLAKGKNLFNGIKKEAHEELEAVENHVADHVAKTTSNVANNIGKRM